MLKRIFDGIVNLILSVIVFVYLLNTDSAGNSVIECTGSTGLPTIAIILLVPGFIFAILALAINSQKLKLIRGVILGFAGIFALISSILATIAYAQNNVQPLSPIIALVFSLTMVVVSCIACFTALKSDQSSKEKAE